MIDIQWGDFVFRADGSVAVIVAAIPLFIVMQLPSVIRGVRKLMRTVQRRSRNPKIDNILERIRKAEM